MKNNRITSCLIAITLLAGCGRGGDGNRTFTPAELEQMRQYVILATPSKGDRLETVEVVQSQETQVVGIALTISSPSPDGRGFAAAVRIGLLWDGKEGGTPADLDLTVNGTVAEKIGDKPPSFHYKCSGETMDRLMGHKLTRAEWEAACAT